MATNYVTAGGTLTMYLASGKKKHERVFWVEQGGMLSWDKKKAKPGKKANKSFPLMSVEPSPAIKSAREWFDMIDADGSGDIDVEELQELYKRARGEKLKGSMLKDAMAQMDTDKSGTIDFSEFEGWWKANGGDLEKYRDLAFTVVAGDVTLLLVAPGPVQKKNWVDGLAQAVEAAEQKWAPNTLRIIQVTLGPL